jgi:hypothetical protein
MSRGLNALNARTRVGRVATAQQRGFEEENAITIINTCMRTS